MAIGLRRHGLMRQDQNYVHPIEDGYGLVKNDVTLQAAITAIGAETKTLMLTPGAWTIANDLTIPANITLYRCMGVTLSVAAGKTFTVLGQLIDDGATVATGANSWLTGPGAINTPSRLASSLPTGVLDGSMAHVTDDVRGLWFKASGTWFPIGGKVYRPEFFPGADIGAKLNACIASMPATGGAIDCRHFAGTVPWFTQVTTSKSVHIVFGKAQFLVASAIALQATGTADLTVVGAALWGTQFIAAHNALKVIEFVSDGHLHVDSIYVGNGGIPQATGFFISLQPPNYSTHHGITRCLTDQVYNAIMIGRANLVTIDVCVFENAVNAEITGSFWGGALFDAGQTYIRDCAFVKSVSTSGFAVLWEDTSGLYMHDNTILGYLIGIIVTCTQNHTFNEFVFSNNRMDEQGQECIVIQRAGGTGGFAHIHIDGNQMSQNKPTFISGIVLGATTGANDILFARVHGNSLIVGISPTCTLLQINHGQDVYVHGNAFTTAPPSNIAINFGTITEAYIGRNKYLGFTPHQVVIPNIPNVRYEGEPLPISVSIDPFNIPANTLGVVNTPVVGLRPTHNDRVGLERNVNLNPGLAFEGAAITLNDQLSIFLRNVTGGAINDGPLVWAGTWLDVVP